MRKDKEKAYSLRTAGKSYAEISANLGIPKATLSKWFSKEEWSKGVRENLVRDGKIEKITRIRELHKTRANRLLEAYKKAEIEALDDWKRLKYDPLFIAGLTLYWSHGDKTKGPRVRFSTSDLEKGRLFFDFLVKAIGVEKGKVRGTLAVYRGQNEESNRRFWAFALGQGVKFTKSSVVPGNFDARKLTYGICTLSLGSTYLKRKMLIWLSFLPKLIDR